MAVSPTDFDQARLHQLDAVRAKRDEQDDEVIRILQAIIGRAHDPQSLSSQEFATKGLSFEDAIRRSIQVPVDGTLDRERLEALSEFYEEERALSTAMLAFSDDMISSYTANANGDRVYACLRKLAIRELVSNQTDTATQALNLVAIIDERLPAFGVRVFDEVFESCQEPNSAEIEFLSHFCGVADAVTKRWFTSKRARLRNFLIARELMKTENPAELLDKAAQRKQDGKDEGGAEAENEET